MGLAMQLGEHADFGAKQFGNDRNGNVIDGPALIALEAVQIGEVHRGDEDDGGLLEARMLADHVGEFEAVDFRHADVHEDNRDVGF